MAANVNIYEILFMLDSGKVGSDLPAVVQKIHGILERYGAEVMASRPWSDLKLSYPIKGQKKSPYYLIYIQSDAKNLVEIDRDLKLNEAVLRFLTLKIEKKLEDVMLAIAKDEHALALQTAVNDDTDYNDMGSGRDRDRDRGGYRGRAEVQAQVAAAGAEAKD